MNRLTHSLLVTCFSLGTLVASLHAQAPAADPFVKDAAGGGAGEDGGRWKQCLVVLEIYAMDKADAQSVLDAERGSAARYRRVLDLNRAGKARLQTLSALTTKSGQRAIVEGIDEVRYPTEFNPPELKNAIAAPTAWETRNTGDSFELEPVIGPDGRTCDLNLVPQIVTLMGFKDVAGMADDSLISQPIFHTQKVTTSLMTQEGEITYFGTMTPPTPQGMANGEAASEIWLAFMRVHLPSPTAEDMKPRPGERSTNVTLEYSLYSLDRLEAREILAGATTLAAPWEKLQASLNARRARLEHVSTVITKSGQRAVTEEVHEVRYATEYTPEGRRGSNETTRKTITVRPDAKKEDGESLTTEETTINRSDVNSERQPGSVSALETRNAGVTVEVEPVVGPDGVTVDLNQVVSSVAYHGGLQVTGIATRYPVQPLFETSKVTSAISTIFGRNVLLSTLNPPGNDGVNGRTDTGRTWLLFVRAENER